MRVGRETVWIVSSVAQLAMLATGAVMCSGYNDSSAALRRLGDAEDRGVASPASPEAAGRWKARILRSPK